MFKIKRPAIVGLLVVLLLFISFLNYQLTQQSILKASKDYQEFELSEMETNHTDVFNEELPKEEEEEADDSDEKDIEEENDENINENSNDLDAVVSTRDKDITDVIEEAENNDNYFVNFRLSRDKIRAESIDRLNDIINNELTEQEVRSEAQEEVINIGKISETELQIEGLIKSKGFNDSLVFLTSEDIKIVVLSEELKEEEMVKILDIVKSETSIAMENIKIMKKH